MHIILADNGAAGARAQTSGLAAAISELCGGAKIVAHTIRAGSFAGVFPRIAARFFRDFPAADSDSCDVSPPDMAVACGHRAAAAALAMRRKYGAFAVFAQKPPVSVSEFDAVICPLHDEVRGENVLPILGSAGGVRHEDLRRRRAAARRKFAHIPDPKTALLIGGDSRAYRMTPSFCRELAESVRRADPSGGVLATGSRRTGAENTRALAAALSGGGCFFYDGEGGENPYLDILAAADRFVVSGDSVNMLSEAAAAAKPMWCAEPPLRAARAAGKFRRFHGALAERRLARRWEGAFAEWMPPHLDETARAADFVWRRYCESRGERPPAASE